MKLSLPLLSPLEKRFAGLLLVGLLGMSLPWLVRIPGLPLDLKFILDLGTHWQIVWGGSGLIGALGLSVKRRHLFPISACLLGLSSVWWVTPDALRFAQGPHEALTVITANLHFENKDLSKLHKWVDEMDPDILILQEVSPSAAQALQSWDAFKTHSFVPSEDPFGMAALVKMPLATIDWHVETGVPFVQVGITFRNRKVTIFGIHPMPPLAPEYHKDRDFLIASLVTAAQTNGKPSLMVGDFNASPWSSAMPQTTFYRTSAPLPTWQYLLPIDHILATKHFQVIRAGVGPDIGSDHRPAWVKLAIE